MLIDKHLSEGTLQALVDRELSWFATLRCTLHLRRCALCRAARMADHQRRDWTHEFLALIEQPVNIEEGWLRLSAVRRNTTPPRSWRPPAVAWASFALVAMFIGAFALHRRGLVSATHGEISRRDICCWDLDGGGPGDDGVMTVSRLGEQLDCVVLYDDLDHSRSLTPGDAIRYISHPASCGFYGVARPSWADSAFIAQLALAY